MDEFSESDLDDVEPKRNPAEILGALELQLMDLLYVGSGRPPSAELIYVRRRVLRGNADHPGYAAKVAKFFEAVLLSVNETHNLQSFPVNIKHVLERMSEGNAILDKTKATKETEVLAQAAVKIVAGAGRACKGSVSTVRCCVCAL